MGFGGQLSHSFYSFCNHLWESPALFKATWMAASPASDPRVGRRASNTPLYLSHLR